VLAQACQHPFEQMKALGFIFIERIALAVAAEADHLPQMLECDEMLAPEVIEGLQQHHLLDSARLPRTDRFGRSVGRALDVRDDFTGLRMLAIKLKADRSRVHGLRRRSAVDADG